MSPSPVTINNNSNYRPIVSNVRQSQMSYPLAEGSIIRNSNYQPLQVGQSNYRTSYQPMQGQSVYQQQPVVRESVVSRVEPRTIYRQSAVPVGNYLSYEEPVVTTQKYILNEPDIYEKRSTNYIPEAGDYNKDVNVTKDYGARRQVEIEAVSYTHLTLPTIYSV